MMWFFIVSIFPRIFVSTPSLRQYLQLAIRNLLSSPFMVCHIPASAKNIHSGLRFDRFFTRFWDASIINDGSRSSSGLGSGAGTRGGRPPTGAGKILVAALVAIGKVAICEPVISAGTVATAGAFDIAGRVWVGSDVTKGALTMVDGSLVKGRLATGCALTTGGIFDIGGIDAIGDIVDTIGTFGSTCVSVGSGIV